MAGAGTEVVYGNDTSTFARTRFLSYDAFGRAGRIIPPDGASHDVLIDYVGVREIVRVRRPRSTRWSATIPTAACGP